MVLEEEINGSNDSVFSRIRKSFTGRISAYALVSSLVFGAVSVLVGCEQKEIGGICTSDSDCKKGYECALGVCKKIEKKATVGQGEPCVYHDECKKGCSCIDDICRCPRSGERGYEMEDRIHEERFKALVLKCPVEYDQCFEDCVRLRDVDGRTFFDKDCEEGCKYQWKSCCKRICRGTSYANCVFRCFEPYEKLIKPRL